MSFLGHYVCSEGISESIAKILRHGKLLPSFYSTLRREINTSERFITSQKGIAKMLHELNVNKACGPDSLSSHVLKKCATELEPSLAHLFTRSFQSGCIPFNGSKGTCLFTKKVTSPRSPIIDQYLYYVFCQK